MIPYSLPAHAYQSSVSVFHQPLPLIPAKNMTGLKTGKIQRTNETDAQRGDFHVVSDKYERYVVQPLSPFAATNHGVVRRTKVIPKTTEEDQNGPIETNTPQGDQDTHIVFAFAEGNLRNGFIIGHITPQVSEMQFKDTDYVDRHHTDSVQLENNDGNRAEYMPDGTGVVIGEPGFDHPADLDPANNGEKNFDWEDKPWKLTKRHDNQYTINQQSGGAKIHMNTDGDVLIHRDNASFQVHKDGKVSISSDGPQGINTPKLTIDASTVHITGTLHVDQVIANNVQSRGGSVPGPIAPGTSVTPDGGSPVTSTVPYVKKDFKSG